jgi:hypothetical protein
MLLRIRPTGELDNANIALPPQSAYRNCTFPSSEPLLWMLENEEEHTLIFIQVKSLTNWPTGVQGNCPRRSRWYRSTIVVTAQA